MANNRSIANCPWRGTDPYEEQDSHRFYGRKDELRGLLQLVISQRFTILTAESGAGKTSLIKAGLIPALRVLRERSPEKMGPVLCVRDWTSGSPAALMIDAIAKEVKRLAELSQGSEVKNILGIDQLRSDMAAAKAVAPIPITHGREPREEMDSLLQYVGRLCDAIAGQELVLVIDQAEEFMGSVLSRTARNTEAAALQVVGDLFKYEKRIRILLSLREEYFARLRPLEMMVAPFARRTCTILPMTAGSEREAARRAAERSGHVRITPEALDQVLRWVVSPQKLEDELPVDMLGVGAFLEDIYLWTPDRDEGGAALADGAAATETFASIPEKPAMLHIDMEYLSAYKGSLESEQPRLKEQLESWLAEGPMLRRIERSFDDAARVELGGAELARAKRAAARMADALSSPRGFKRHVTNVDLVFHAIREDLRIPIMLEKVPLSDVRKFLSEVGPAADEISRHPELGSRAESAIHLPEVVLTVTRAGFDAIRVLTDNRILKHQGHDEHGYPILTLQHDGFGPALAEWGELAQSQPEDVLFSAVATCGSFIEWKRPVCGKPADKMQVKRMDLIGCWLKGVRFEDVEFTNCTMDGTWFNDCTFVRCSFVGCNLRAIGFLGGYWEDTTFQGCDAKSSLIKEIKWNGVHLMQGTDISIGVFSNFVFAGNV